ncbi:hypothetical protein PENSPDRAFT_688388 [Peniophora sp. CONT]|nr:hypothetical protein PENSPDRAFT_688388 [Peniophora sp. CONT]
MSQQAEYPQFAPFGQTLYYYYLLQRSSLISHSPQTHIAPSSSKGARLQPRALEALRSLVRDLHQPPCAFHHPMTSPRPQPQPWRHPASLSTAPTNLQPALTSLLPTPSYGAAPAANGESEMLWMLQAGVQERTGFARTGLVPSTYVHDNS